MRYFKIDKETIQHEGNYNLDISQVPDIIIIDNKGKGLIDIKTEILIRIEGYSGADAKDWQEIIVTDVEFEEVQVGLHTIEYWCDIEWLEEYDSELGRHITTGEFNIENLNYDVRKAYLEVELSVSRSYLDFNLIPTIDILFEKEPQELHNFLEEYVKENSGTTHKSIELILMIDAKREYVLGVFR